MKRILWAGTGLVTAILAAMLLASDVVAQVGVAVKNGFAVCYGVNCDNVLEIGGSVDIGTGGDLDIESGATWRIAGTAVTVTAAELNALASAGISAAEAVQLGSITATAAEINALASGGLSAAEVVILGGYTSTAAQLNELKTGGNVALDGSNPTSVTMSPLTTIHGCSVTIAGSGTPGIDPLVVTVVTDAVAGRLDIYAWAATATDNVTMTASSSVAQVKYVCVGV